jgi:hypothetical protein
MRKGRMARPPGVREGGPGARHGGGERGRAGCRVVRGEQIYRVERRVRRRRTSPRLTEDYPTSNHAASWRRRWMRRRARP